MLDEADILVALVGKRHLPMPYSAFRQLTRDEQVRCVLDLAQRAHVLPPDSGPQQIQRFLDVYKATVQATAEYQPQRYPGQIVLCQAAAPIEADAALETLDSAVDVDSAAEWAQLSMQPLALHVTPGSHRTMVAAPHVSALAAVLQSYLQTIQPG
jgi:thioesterase domain-containing protein